MKPPLIVGCDPSSKHLAFAALQGVTNTLVTHSVQLAPRKSDKFHVSNLYMARLETLSFIETIKPMGKGCDKWLVIEYPVVGRGGARSTLVQVLVQGVVQECFYEAGYEVTSVWPITWKKFLGVKNRGRRSTTDHGRGPKQAIVQAMKARFPKDATACGNDNDLFDACAIARWGMDSHRRGNLVVA